MSDYTRMVSYFYRYQNGSKMENVGYGRVECRQEKLRVTLNLNDSKTSGNLDCDIYFYRYEKGKMKIIKLGKAVFSNGNFSYHKEFEEKDVIPEETNLNGFSGMLAYHDDSLFYGSQWDEEPIYMKDFARAKRELEAPKQEVIMESKPEAEQQQKKVESEKTEIGGESSSRNIEAQQIPNREAQLTGIPYLLKHRSPLPDFANHEVMQCVRIMPEDIGLLNRANWDYGNNSFVMHGFYNYRYLLLGSMQFGDGARQYVLGVPGIFSNKDKYLAGIFGFHEFIPLHNCPYKTGEFGYWIGKLK